MHIDIMRAWKLTNQMISIIDGGFLFCELRAADAVARDGTVRRARSGGGPCVYDGGVLDRRRESELLFVR